MFRERGQGRTGKIESRSRSERSRIVAVEGFVPNWIPHDLKLDILREPFGYRSAEQTYFLCSSCAISLK
jgi:hypothetical protein